MKVFEKVSMRVRHSSLLERADWLWDRLRPMFSWQSAIFGRNGLERLINGTDKDRDGKQRPHGSYPRSDSLSPLGSYC